MRAKPGRAWRCRKTTPPRKPKATPPRSPARPRLRTTATNRRRLRPSAARTCASSSKHRADEADQAVAAQHQLADMAVVPGLGILEAETALEAEAAVVAAAQADAAGVHGLVEQLHAGRVAGAA